MNVLGGSTEDLEDVSGQRDRSARRATRTSVSESDHRARHEPATTTAERVNAVDRQTDPRLPRTEIRPSSTSELNDEMLYRARERALKDGDVVEVTPPYLVVEAYTNATTKSAQTSSNATRASALPEMFLSIERCMGSSVLSQS